MALIMPTEPEQLIDMVVKMGKAAGAAALEAPVSKETLLSDLE